MRKEETGSDPPACCVFVPVVCMQGYDTEVGPPPKPAAGDGGSSSGSGDGSGGGGADGGDNGADVPRSELIYMVTLSVMVYVGLWSICWLRASQFSRRLNATLPQRAGLA